MSICTRLDLLRHGECEGGAIFRGRCEVGLSATGREQMQKALAGAGPWQVVVTSPLSRCQTFAAGFVTPPVELVVDERLREMSFGDWDGCLIEDIWRRDPDTIGAWSHDPSRCTPPGGEPLIDLAARVEACYQDLLQRYRGQKVLLITHGGVIRVLLAARLAMPLSHAGRLDVPYACLSSLAVFHHEQGDTVKLLAHNRGSDV